MRKFSYGALVALAAVTACGGGENDMKPAQAPAPPVSVNSAQQTPPPVDTMPPPAAEAPKPSMTDMQASAMKTMMDGMNAHDADKATSVYTDDAVVMMAGMPNAQGKDALKDRMKALWVGFPDMKMAVGRTWQKNDVLVWEYGWTGTQTGEFMGMKPTKKPVGVMAVSVHWFTPEGKIKETHRYVDMGSLGMQLGMPKAKGRAMVGLPTTTETHVAKGTGDEDKNVDAIKASSAAVEKKDAKAFLDSMTDDSTYDANVMPKPMQGKKSAEAWFKSFTHAFPDLKSTSTNMWGVEDYVINEYVMTGTQKGALSGPAGTIPATGKPVTLHGVEIFQLKDGKMVHGWGYENGAEFAMQLGLMKPPGQPKADASAKGGASSPAPAPAPTKK